MNTSACGHDIASTAGPPPQRRRRCRAYDRPAAARPSDHAAAVCRRPARSSPPAGSSPPATVGSRRRSTCRSRTRSDRARRRPRLIGAPGDRARPSPGGSSTTLRGLVDDAASLTANGQPVALEPGGGVHASTSPRARTEVRLAGHRTPPATHRPGGRRRHATRRRRRPTRRPPRVHVQAAGLGQPGDPRAGPRPGRGRPDQRRRSSTSRTRRARSATPATVAAGGDVSGADGVRLLRRPPGARRAARPRACG